MLGLKHYNYTALGLRIEDFLKLFTRAMIPLTKLIGGAEQDEQKSQGMNQICMPTDMWTQCGPNGAALYCSHL